MICAIIIITFSVTFMLFLIATINNWKQLTIIWIYDTSHLLYYYISVTGIYEILHLKISATQVPIDSNYFWKHWLPFHSKNNL